ncbi:hypothetical protein C3489_36470 [Streptomyces sp. Ru71]|uniref:hypothetical protein n=1 Tax=Streptomyces sp. Ru71 TaxID=2080746 RepID=UPI000CDD787B|nr:hypothetical protein [Streptomyces sp. Ru71]POX44424.1 hypothetical protein C3489_36470 [Streptomyces sp. Ru71]
MVHRPSSGSWQVAADSPHREPVLYAVGEMTQTLRARGETPAVAVWGPGERGWERYEPSAPARTARPAGPASAAPTSRQERLHDRRHQVLLAGLSAAGLDELAEEDEAAVRTLVERLDETTVRRIAHWLSTAAAA